MEYIVFVTQDGAPTGKIGPKLASHTGDTQLHLGFSGYVFNDEGKVLVTRRADTKKVWPGVWTNTVCGHPGPDESLDVAAQRRLEYELCMTARDLRVVLPDYLYKTPPFNGIIEHEFCPVLFARANEMPVLNADEVAEYKWMEWQAFIDSALADTTDQWSWWCKDQLKELVRRQVDPIRVLAR